MWFDQCGKGNDHGTFAGEAEIDGFNKTFDFAKRGDMAAQRFLGFLYFLGDGVPQDKIEAYKWFWLAARQGEKAAVAVIQYVLPHLSAEDLVEAKLRIQVFEKGE